MVLRVLRVTLWLSRRRRGEEQRDSGRYGRESAPGDVDLLVVYGTAPQTGALR